MVADGHDVQVDSSRSEAGRGTLVGAAVLRIAVVLAAAAASWYGPAALAAPVVLVAAVLVVERVARLRRRGRLDATLVGVAGAFATVILLGLLLDRTGWGLTRGSWLIALTAVGVVAVVVTAPLRAAPVVTPAELRGSWLTSVSVLIGAALLGLALTLATSSQNEVLTAPLQLAATDPTSGRTEVTVTAEQDAGPFELHLVTIDSDVVIEAGITVGPGRARTIPVTLPDGFEVSLQLRRPGDPTVVREVILSNGTLLPGGGP